MEKILRGYLSFSYSFFWDLAPGIGSWGIPSVNPEKHWSKKWGHSMVYSLEAGTLWRVDIYNKDSQIEAIQKRLLNPQADEYPCQFKDGHFQELKEEPPKDPDWRVGLLRILQAILVPAQTAMFILALRNRFRR